MRVQICEAPFDPWAALQAYQEERRDDLGSFGATAVFVGTMRDFNEGAEVECMTLEHYPGMTEKEVARIVEQANLRWQIIDTLVVHRIGDIYPTDPIVLAAVWSTHRGDALDSCRHIMEALKSRAPFWKKESRAGSGRWVERNTSGYKAS